MVITLSVDETFLKEMDSFRVEWRRATGVTLTRAYLFREGARKQMHGLRVQLGKAKRGKVGPKQRPIMFGQKPKL